MNKTQILGLVQEVYKSTIEEIYMGCPSPDVLEAYNKITDLLMTPSYTPKSLELTYATIKYWEKNKYLILPISNEAEEWRKYCLLEVLWFNILKKLVKMGCTLEFVVPKLIEGYRNLNSENVGGEVKPPVIIEIEKTLGIKLDPLITFLSQVVEILVRRSKAAIHFTEKGCNFYFEKDSSEKAINPNHAYESLFITGISIGLSDIVFESIAGLDYIKEDKVEIFSKNELEIIELLRKKQLKEINIKLNNGRPVQLELKEVFDITMDDATKRLKEFFFKPYQEINAITNGGRTIKIERTTKKKIYD